MQTRLPPDAVPSETRPDLGPFESRAGAAARWLRLLANEKRLMILCQLVLQAEMDVGRLAASVGLSQSALSQHLARLREDGVVAFRRESQTLHYRIADQRVVALLSALKETFCPPADA